MERGVAVVIEKAPATLDTITHRNQEPPASAFLPFLCDPAGRSAGLGSCLPSPAPWISVGKEGYIEALELHIAEIFAAPVSFFFMLLRQ